MDNNILDVEGVSKLLGISKYSVYRLLKEKKIPTAKIGREYRFHKPSIIEWVATHNQLNGINKFFDRKDIKFVR